MDGRALRRTESRRERRHPRSKGLRQAASRVAAAQEPSGIRPQTDPRGNGHQGVDRCSPCSLERPNRDQSPSVVPTLSIFVRDRAGTVPQPDRCTGQFDEGSVTERSAIAEPSGGARGIRSRSTTGPVRWTIGTACSSPPCDLGVKNSRRGTGIAADQRATAQRIYHTAITGGAQASGRLRPCQISISERRYAAPLDVRAGILNRSQSVRIEDGLARPSSLTERIL